MLVAIIAILSMPALSIYAWQTTTVYTEQNAVDAALQFVGDSPTYGWDGIEDSIELVEAYKTGNPDAEWEIVVAFTSANAGYGDRSDMMVATVITDHVVKVTVEGDRVTAAVTDGVYDELTGKLGTPTRTEADVAQDLALEYMMNSPTFLFDGIAGSMEIKEVMIAESFPVQYFIIIEFQSSHAGYGDREGQMLAQVITPHESRVVVVSGEVTTAVIDGVWGVREQMESSRREPVSMEVVTASLEYLKGHYPVVHDVEIPEDWSVSVFNQGAAGANEVDYRSQGWEVVLSWEDAREPEYTVDVRYGEDTWALIVDHTFAVEEH